MIPLCHAHGKGGAVSDVMTGKQILAASRMSTRKKRALLPSFHHCRKSCRNQKKKRGRDTGSARGWTPYSVEVQTYSIRSAVRISIEAMPAAMHHPGPPTAVCPSQCLWPGSDPAAWHLAAGVPSQKEELAGGQATGWPHCAGRWHSVHVAYQIRLLGDVSTSTYRMDGTATEYPVRVWGICKVAQKRWIGDVA